MYVINVFLQHTSFISFYLLADLSGVTQLLAASSGENDFWPLNVFNKEFDLMNFKRNKIQ